MLFPVGKLHFLIHIFTHSSCVMKGKGGRGTTNDPGTNPADILMGLPPPPSTKVTWKCEALRLPRPPLLYSFSSQRPLPLSLPFLSWNGTCYSICLLTFLWFSFGFLLFIYFFLVLFLVIVAFMPRLRFVYFGQRVLLFFSLEFRIKFVVVFFLRCFCFCHGSLYIVHAL